MGAVLAKKLDAVTHYCELAADLQRKFSSLYDSGILIEISDRGIHVNHNIFKGPGVSRELKKVLAFQEAFTDLCNNKVILSLGFGGVLVRLKFLLSMPGLLSIETRNSFTFPYKYKKTYEDVPFFALSNKRRWELERL